MPLPRMIRLPSNLGTVRDIWTKFGTYLRPSFYIIMWLCAWLLPVWFNMAAAAILNVCSKAISQKRYRPMIWSWIVACKFETVRDISTKFSDRITDVIFNHTKGAILQYIHWNSIFWRPPSLIFVKAVYMELYKISSQNYACKSI